MAVQRPHDWTDNIGQWLPILIVIGIGLLSGIKRYIDVKRARPGGGTGRPEEKPPEHPIMEEVRKYLDTYEGRQPEEKKPEEKKRPAPAPRREPRPAAQSRAVAVAAAAVRDPASLIRPLTALAPKKMAALPSRRPRLTGAKIRSAFMWRELLRPPIALRDTPPGDLLH